jgi:hypothetical protein
MPMTPTDTKTTLADEITEQVEDTIDTLALYARRRPFMTVTIAFVLGLIAARCLS